MTKLGLTHKQLGEQVLAMGELIGTVQQDLSVENDAKLQDEAAMQDKIREQQNKVVVDTENITISFNEQKKFCMRYEILAKRTDLILKTAVREDTLYCKKQETKAKLCRADNAKSYANIKKRRAEARVRSKEILTASMKAAKFAMNDETDTLNPKMDVLVVARVRHAMRAHRAAIAALNYLEYSEKIFLRRQAKKDLVSKNPEKVCFPVDIVINSTLTLTQLQEQMRSKNEQALRAAKGVKCIKENLKLIERGDKEPPCTAFEFLKGDAGVKLWYDASKTKAATAEMNAVIINAALFSAAANRTLFEELSTSKKDAMAMASAEEAARCKSHALAVAKALQQDQAKHDARDEAFEHGDLCHADVRTVFIEFMSATRHRVTKLSQGKRLSAMLRMHANERARRRALLTDAGWRSRVKSSQDADGNKVYSVSCDTKFKCKAKFVEEANKGNSEKEQCAICTDQLYTEGFASYGADKGTEKSAFGRYNAPMEHVVGRWDYEYGFVNRLNRKDPGPPKDADKCLDKVDDSFELPCCRPYRYPSGSLVVVDPKDAVSVAKIGPITGFDKEVKCCGGGPACCRWCPEKLCDSLEKVPENLPKLWFHVCSGEDTKPSWPSLGKESN
jgi:hypothetical protein